MSTADSPAFSKAWNAAKTGNVDELTAVIQEHPKFVNEYSTQGSGGTLMHVATENGHIDIIEKLVELGGSIVSRDARSMMPIHIAARKGHAMIIELLVLLCNKVIDMPISEGWTPMRMAVQYGHTEVIETLVRLGSCVNNTLYDKTHTLVYTAAYNNDKPCIRTLKLLGADCSSVPFTSTSESTLKLLNSTIDETEIAELRYRIYFSRSLMERVLLELKVRHLRRRARIIKYFLKKT